SLDPLCDSVDRSDRAVAPDPSFRAEQANAFSSRFALANRLACEGRNLSSIYPGATDSRSDLKNSNVPSSLQLVQQERRFYFIGRTDRRVIFSVLADSLDEARQKFRASGHPDSDALFIIKTETEIYLA